LRDDGRFLEGIGEGTSISEREDAEANAKKIAVTNARKDAFKKLVIIVLPSKKIAIHIKGTELPETFKTQEQSQTNN